MTNLVMEFVFNSSLFPNQGVIAARIIGWCAGVFSVFAFMPQAIKTFKTKKTRGLSLGMYSLYIAGNVCWILWAFFDLIAAILLGHKGSQLIQSVLGDLTIIIPNIIATVTTSIIVYIKIRNIVKHQDYGGKILQLISAKRELRRQKKQTMQNNHSTFINAHNSADKKDTS